MIRNILIDAYEFSRCFHYHTKSSFIWAKESFLKQKKKVFFFNNKMYLYMYCIHLYWLEFYPCKISFSGTVVHVNSIESHLHAHNDACSIYLKYC